jgi:thiol-disulfide isomerase/thioredoxin
MQGQIERLLPLLATWGAPGLAALLVATLLAIGRLGRGRPFLVPARWPARIAALALIALAGVWAAGLWVVMGPMRPVLGQVRYVESIVNRPAAETEFREVATDAPRRLSELRGKVVVLNLWATWCGPCRGELPAIDRLQQAYAARGLVVVTLSTEDRDHLRAFAAQHPLGTLNVYAPRIDWLDIPGRPLSLVIDRDGVVRNCFIGARTYGEFEHAVMGRLGAAS